MRLARISRFMPTLLTVVVAGCFVLNEGRQQTINFTTPLFRSEVTTRSLAWFATHHYEVKESRTGFVKGEIVRTDRAGAGQDVDVLNVTMDALDQGTRVAVQALTYDLVNGQRRLADQVSLAAIHDGEALSDTLMVREVEPPR